MSFTKMSQGQIPATVCKTFHEMALPQHRYNNYSLGWTMLSRMSFPFLQDERSFCALNMLGEQC